MKLSSRAQKTAASPLRSLVGPKDKSVHIHKLNIGQPDLAAPKEFFDGLKSFSDTLVAYDEAVGNKRLISAWVRLLKRQYGIELSTEDLLITCGSSEALTFIFSICCDANDEVVVFNPSYANYSGFAAVAGVTLVPVATSFESGFHIPTSKDDILSHVTEKTRAILLCNPNNPTGTLFTHEELKTILDICEEKDLFLIVDEVYREFVYDNQKPSTTLSLFPKNERLIVLDSLSKRYSLCGTRIGCLITYNKDVMKAAKNFASTRVSAPSIEQQAAAHMLETLSDEYLDDAIKEYESRRDLLVAELSKIEGVELNAPQGGFYVLAKLPVDDASDFAQFMLRDFSVNDETTFVAPAAGFFINSQPVTNYVRVAFVLSCDEIKRAAIILDRALTTYTIMKAAKRS